MPAGLAVEVHVLELEQHAELAGLGMGQVDGVLGRRHRRLADGDDVALRQHLALHLAQKFVQPRPLDEMLAAPLVAAVAGHRRIGQARHLGDEVMTSMRKPSMPLSSHQRIMS